MGCDACPHTDGHTKCEDRARILDSEFATGVVPTRSSFTSEALQVYSYSLFYQHNQHCLIDQALELIRQNRSIRPNAGFLQQLADLENTLSKRVVW